MCCHVERISFDMADCTHFKRKRSQYSACSLNCTEWKSALKSKSRFQNYSERTRIHKYVPPPFYLWYSGASVYVSKTVKDVEESWSVRILI